MAILSPQSRSKIAHAVPKIYVTLAVLYPLLAAAMAIPALTVAAFVAVMVMITAQWTFILITEKHDRGLCEICASMTPLDGTTEAAKQDRLLKRFHNRKFALPGLAAIFLAPLVVLLFDLPSMVTHLGISVGLAYTALLKQASIVHRVLYPWCPYCRRRRRWEDGGDPEPAPTPDPSVQARL